MRIALSRLLGGGAVTFALLLAAGCEKKGTTGGPGVTGTSVPGSATTTTIVESHQTFNVTVPSTSTTIKQGESKTVTIGVSRGRDFDQTVALKFNDLPAGVTVDPPNAAVKSGDKETSVGVAAAASAAPGDYVIKVVGQPATGDASTADLKITIEKK
jgi:hypothetical protein